MLLGLQNLNFFGMLFSELINYQVSTYLWYILSWHLCHQLSMPMTCQCQFIYFLQRITSVKKVNYQEKQGCSSFFISSHFILTNLKKAVLPRKKQESWLNRITSRNDISKLKVMKKTTNQLPQTGKLKTKTVNQKTKNKCILTTFKDKSGNLLKNCSKNNSALFDVMCYLSFSAKQNNEVATV